jgi:hypothetical protein
MSLIAALPFVGKVLDKIFPDKEDAAAAKLKLLELEQSGELKELETAAGIVSAEAKSEHWLVAAWRPITMLVFVVIIANNYILYPYLSLFFTEAPILDIPPEMWELLKLGIGGYILGRSAEKGFKTYNETKNKSRE